MHELLTVLTFGVFTTAAYYLAARAEITAFLWKRYPRFLDRLARCPACSGTWLGGALAIVMPLPEPHQIALLPDGWRLALQILVGAAHGLFLAPIGTWLLLVTLERTTIPDHGEDISDHGEDTQS